MKVNLQPTRRQDERFCRSPAVNNTTAPQNTTLSIVGVKNNAGPAGEDVVSQATKTAFTAQTPESFTYDLDGNLTADARWLYTWDAENRPTSMTTQPSAATAGAPKQKLEFTYDAMGRRFQKTVSVWNPSSGLWTLTSDVRFLYDGWNLLADFLALGTSDLSLQCSYVWGQDLSGSPQGAGGVGGLLLVTSVGGVPSPRVYAAGYDGNGNVQTLINLADGSTSADFEYDPFGNTIKATGAAANVCPFGFSTKYTDSETGLLYYGFRYCNPSTGRWLARDPLGERGGQNVYTFCLNISANAIDALGRDPVFTAPISLPVTPPIEIPFEPGVPGTLDGPPGTGVRFYIPAPGPIGGNYNYNTRPSWTNPDVRTMATSTGVEAQTACRRLALSKFNDNQYFYSNTSIGRATGAAAVLWKRQSGGAPATPPGWLAANAFRGGSVHRGHLIPRVYGGSGSLENIVTQDAGFNLSAFRQAFEYRIDAILSKKEKGGCNYVCVLCTPAYRGRAATGVLDPGKPVLIGFDLAIITSDNFNATGLIQPIVTGNLKNDMSPWNAWDTGNIPLN